MEDVHGKDRTRDELPQSSSGKMIMTTEPKFVPKDAAVIRLNKDTEVKVRLIDCVGYMVKGAEGHEEGGKERLVRTPWFSEEIPFTKAAVIGTQKVIHDHATIGIVVTTDGSITEIPPENYLEAEERTIKELQTIQKPFVVLVNSKKPYGEEAKEKTEELEKRYGVCALAVNCEQLKKEDVALLLEKILYEFPIAQLQFFIPKWVEMLPADSELKSQILSQIKVCMKKLLHIRDVTRESVKLEGPYVQDTLLDHVGLSDGTIQIRLQIDDNYKMLSDMSGIPMESEYELIHTMKELAAMKEKYVKVKDALDAVNSSGYGVVVPELSQIQLEEPAVIRQGNKYGVKIKSKSPSIHMIKANIETEIAPIVGTEQQAKDLITYIGESDARGESIWETNIFGKSIEQLVQDGIRSKLTMISEESQVKLQDTMQKIVNDSKGGLVCIII